MLSWYLRSVGEDPIWVMERMGSEEISSEFFDSEVREFANRVRLNIYIEGDKSDFVFPY